jgi:hypothetical protein
MSLWTSKVKILTKFSALQVLIQGVTALSGFLLVRVLSKSEFAVYTIAASVQATLTVLTDLEISSGMMAVGGRIWQDPARLGRLVVTTLHLRSRLTLFAVPVTSALAIYLFRQNGVPWLRSFALTGAVIATLWGTFMASVYAVPLRLHSLYTVIQKIDLLAAASRFLLLALSWLVLNAFWAIIVTGLMLAFQGVILRARALTVITREAEADQGQTHTLVGLIKKQLLSALFFAFQGQISIWIITTVGSSEKVADLGALTRLGFVFGLVGNVLTGIVVPTFARCESLAQLSRLFAGALITYTVFASALLACSLLFPRDVLWVLGGKYAGLTHEVPWLVANSVMAGLIGVVYALASARGWIWHAWTAPVLTTLAQVLAIPFLHLSTVKGVLVFGLISLLSTLIVVIYMDLRGLWTSWKTGSLAPVAT